MKNSFKLFLITMVKVCLILFGAILLSMIYLVKKQTATFLIPDWQYYVRCKILDRNFNVIRILSNDWLCIPLKDGGWVSSDNRYVLKRLDPEGAIIWQKKGYFHHQITLENETSILALGRTEEMEGRKVVLYDDVYRINLSDGVVTGYFSIYDELKKNPEQLKPFDHAPYDRGSTIKPFTTPLEKFHLNSINAYRGEYIINDLNLASFMLDRDFKFKKFIAYPEKIKKTKDGIYHDMQVVDKDRILLFENFFYDDRIAKPTFKIYEFENEKIVFEFPLHLKDYVESDYSGGVQKIENFYLVGFPSLKIEDPAGKQYSFVGLISQSGEWAHKATLPFRIQDVKLLPYKNFLKLNKVK